MSWHSAAIGVNLLRCRNRAMYSSPLRAIAARKCGLLRRRESDYCRTPTAGFGWRIGKVQNIGSTAQDGTDSFALKPDAASMDDPQRGEARLAGRLKICFDSQFHVARRNSMQVENIRDWNTYCVRIVHARCSQKGERCVHPRCAGC